MPISDDYLARAARSLAGRAAAYDREDPVHHCPSDARNRAAREVLTKARDIYDTEFDPDDLYRDVVKALAALEGNAER